jgi:hypothetical protein
MMMKEERWREYLLRGRERASRCCCWSLMLCTGYNLPATLWILLKGASLKYLKLFFQENENKMRYRRMGLQAQGLQQKGWTHPSGDGAGGGRKWKGRRRRKTIEGGKEKNLVEEKATRRRCSERCWMEQLLQRQRKRMCWWPWGQVNSSYCIGNGGSYVRAAGTEMGGAERIRRAW